MEDLALNENKQVFIDHTADLAMVEGRDAFEQAISLEILSRYRDITGEFDAANARELARVQARRVARELGFLDRVAVIEVSFSETDVKTLELRIVYDTGEESLLEVSP